MTLTIHRTNGRYVVRDDYGTHRFESEAKSDCIDYAAAQIAMGKASGLLDYSAGE